MYNENPLLLNPISFITSPFQSFTPKIHIKMDPKVKFIYTEMQSWLERDNHIFDDDEKYFSCIFRVPESLLEINKEAYQPQIVSIGPYHKDKDLPMIREQKWRYLNGLLKEMRKEKRTNKPLKYLINSIVSIEEKIRQSYSETILDNSSEDLAMMMILDGVFLIELFRKFGNINHIHQKDPIFKMVWVLPFLMRDFLRIENQIPFFVLQTLFDESQTEKDDPTLPSLILKFFNYGALRPKEVLSEYDYLNGEHLLDLFRKSFLIKKTDASIGNGTPGHVVDRPNQELDPSTKPTDSLTRNETSVDGTCDLSNELNLIAGATPYGNQTSDEFMFVEIDSVSEETVASNENVARNENEMLVGCALYGNRTLNEGTSTVRNEPEKTHPKETVANNRSFERIQSATKLVVAGVKFKKNDEAKSFLDIKFQKGVLLIPQINLDDFYTHFILNGMIFEQCYSDCSKDITTYIVFLGCLINTSMDVGLLSDKKVIQNYLGTDKELVKFFNNVVKYVSFGVEDNYLKDVFNEINDYCDNGLHVGWAGFKHTYFDSPWTFISAFAAFVLLCLTVTQTFYTVYPYYN